MVDKNFDFCVPSTTQRVDGADPEVVVISQQNRDARRGFGETRVRLGASGETGGQGTTSSLNWDKECRGTTQME